MSLATSIAFLVVILLHIAFLVLEMFLWDTKLGLRILGHSRERAASTKMLAANQGLYNGFLAAGLLWGLSLGTEGFAINVFFLCCIISAGLFGAATVSRIIFYVQALPALVALLLLLFA
jgi:putative membrane protein